MNDKKLTGKKVKVGIKNGMTIQDFCQKYECTPDELRKRIGQLFTVQDTAQQIWNDIEANRRKKKRKSKEASTSDTIDEKMENTEEATVDKTVAPTLDELKAAEAEYSDAVIKLEIRYKSCHQEREKGRKTYQKLRDEIRELKESYQEKWRAAEKIIRQDNKLVDEMNEICKLHNLKQMALEKIRDNIKEMDKIVILIYSNHEIALLDETAEIDLDDTGYDELFYKLREQKEAEDFRLKDLRVVARMIKIVANLGDTSVDILFEDDETKKAYDILAKSA